MNKMKSYTEYIVLVVIAVVLLLYIILRSAGNINYKLPDTATVDYETISSITIEGPLNLEFTKSDDQWEMEPEGWTADNSNVTAIAKALGDLKIADLISTSGNPGIYDLDEEHRVLVKAYVGDELVREVYTGKVSGNGMYTYIMLPGNENIYSIRGNLPSRVKDKNSMRDKKFLQLGRNSILKMTLHTLNMDTVTLFKDPADVWRSDKTEPDDAAVKAAVNLVDPLRCKDFLYDEPSGGPMWSIEFLTGDNAVTTLDIWPETDEKIYPARSSQNGYLVKTTPYAVEKLLGAFGVEFSDD